MKLESLSQDTLTFTATVKHKIGKDHLLIPSKGNIEGRWTEIIVDVPSLEKILGHQGKQGKYLFFGIPLEDTSVEF